MTDNLIEKLNAEAKGIVVSGDIHGDITPLVFKCCIREKYRH